MDVRRGAIRRLRIRTTLRQQDSFFVLLSETFYFYPHGDFFADLRRILQVDVQAVIERDLCIYLAGR
jgi:hypothetical protein